MSRKNNKDVVSFSVSQSSLHSSTHHIDEDELTSVCDFEEDNRAQVIDLSGFDGNTHRTIVVNMTESSDVEIKPATQFYAPVTIHQHYNTTSTHPNANPPVAPPVTSTESINYRDKLEKETNSRFTTTSHAKINFCSSATSRNLVYILGIVVGLIITVTFIVTIIYFTIPSRNDEKNELRPHLPVLDEDVAILTRERWGGYAMRDGWQNRSLSHPVKLVIVGHTVSSQCSTFLECAPKMQTIQNWHVESRDWVSIGYNFVIGGDGNVYEGLGWDIKNYIRDNSIMISFIGNYVIDKVKDKQRKAAQFLLKRGVELGKLVPNYTLVAHNQVANTRSPGKNLMADLKQWPHYYAGQIT